MHTKDFLRKKIFLESKRFLKSKKISYGKKNRENKSKIISIKYLFFFFFFHAESNKLFLRAKVCKMSFNYLKQCPSNCIIQFSNILHLYQLASVITSY